MLRRARAGILMWLGNSWLTDTKWKTTSSKIVKYKVNAQGKHSRQKTQESELGACRSEGKGQQSESEKEQPDRGGKARLLKMWMRQKNKVTTLVLDQVKTWHISTFPLDKNAVRTGLLAETNDLCYSGEREGTSSRSEPQSEFKDSQGNLMKPPSQKGKKTVEWEQGSAVGNLSVCEPPGSVSIHYQSPVWKLSGNRLSGRIFGNRAQRQVSVRMCASRFSLNYHYQSIISVEPKLYTEKASMTVCTFYHV